MRRRSAIVFLAWRKLEMYSYVRSFRVFKVYRRAGNVRKVALPRARAFCSFAIIFVVSILTWKLREQFGICELIRATRHHVLQKYFQARRIGVRSCSDVTSNACELCKWAKELWYGQNSKRRLKISKFYPKELFARLFFCFSTTRYYFLSKYLSDEDSAYFFERNFSFLFRGFFFAWLGVQFPISTPPPTPIIHSTRILPDRLEFCCVSVRSR